MDSVNIALPIFKYSFPQLITMETCNEFRNSFPQSNTSNVKAWHSKYNTHEITNVFDPLIDVALNECYNISREFFACNIKTGYRFVVNNLWLAMYENSDHTLIHHHFPYQFAACYYVDVKDDSSPITFGVNNDTTSIQPETGMLLIWNGIVPHQVAPTNNERTCICMNMDNIPIFN